MSNDTDADLTALIADVRANAESARLTTGTPLVHDVLRLVDAVERLTRERDDARAENERWKQVAADMGAVACERFEALEAAEAEVAGLRTRLADAEAVRDQWKRTAAAHELQANAAGARLADAEATIQRVRGLRTVCRRCRDERPHGEKCEPAVVIAWGRYFSDEDRGPRCWEHLPEDLNRLTDWSQWAVLDMRPINALDGPQDGGEGR